MLDFLLDYERTSNLQQSGLEPPLKRNHFVKSITIQNYARAFIQHCHHWKGENSRDPME